MESVLYSPVRYEDKPRGIRTSICSINLIHALVIEFKSPLMGARNVTFSKLKLVLIIDTTIKVDSLFLCTEVPMRGRGLGIYFPWLVWTRISSSIGKIQARLDSRNISISLSETMKGAVMVSGVVA